MVAVVNLGGGRKTWEAERLPSSLWGEEVRETERLRSRRARARAEAVGSGEGGSPKMKNLMKQPIRMTTESWPRRKPWVNERLVVYQHVIGYNKCSDVRAHEDCCGGDMGGEEASGTGVCGIS